MARDVIGRATGEVARGSSGAEIERFLSEARTSGNREGRLVFALDATMSRQPTWDRACQLQGEMFDAVGSAASLAVQLVYFRGFGECRASRWVTGTQALRDLMTRIDCRGGQTQIGRVLSHARSAAAKAKLGGLVYIGDAMEEEADALCRTAGELGVLAVPCFMVQEGRDAATERVFREIARLSGGAYLRLDESTADQLRNLLRAVAVFATKGLSALESEGSRESRLLIEQMRRGGGR